MNNYYGLNCQYLTLNSTTFIGSTILTQEQGISLFNLIGNQSISKTLYRASRDGFLASSFHSKCDNKGATLTLIKSSNGNIFGGFTKANWNGNSWIIDSNAFLFSLINQYDYPIKLNIKSDKVAYAINANPSYGPYFGDAPDLYIADQSNSNTNSFSQLGGTYDLPQNFAFLAGTPYFSTLEIEVYQIDGNIFYYI